MSVCVVSWTSCSCCRRSRPRRCRFPATAPTAQPCAAKHLGAVGADPVETAMLAASLDLAEFSPPDAAVCDFGRLHTPRELLPARRCGAVLGVSRLRRQDALRAFRQLSSNVSLMSPELLAELFRLVVESGHAVASYTSWQIGGYSACGLTRSSAPRPPRRHSFHNELGLTVRMNWYWCLDPRRRRNPQFGTRPCPPCGNFEHPARVRLEGWRTIRCARHGEAIRSP